MVSVVDVACSRNFDMRFLWVEVEMGDGVSAGNMS